LSNFLQMLVRERTNSTLFAFLALAAVFAVLATRVEIDGSVDRLMLRSDPARVLDAQAKVDFGNDEIIMVGFELPAPYDADDLRKLRTISERIGELDHVRRIKDLSSTEDIVGVGDVLDAGPLIDFDRLDGDLDRIRARVEGHPLYDGLLVSDDGRALGMMVYADSVESNDESTNALTAEVMAIAREMAPPWNTHFAGYPVTAYEVNRIVKRDLALLTPLSLLAIFSIVFLFTRRIAAVAIGLALIVWVELAALAWLGATGTPINVVISTLPTILIATSGTYLVYALGLLAKLGSLDHPGVKLIRLLVKPVLLSSMSTAIGFGSLRAIGMQSAGELGMALSAGIVAAATGSLLLVPALVHRFGITLAPREPGWMQTLPQIGVRASRRPGLVLAGAAVVLAAALPGLARLQLHTDTLQYFAPENPVRTGADFFQEELSSGFLLNIVLRSEEEGRAIDPDTLAFAKDLRSQIESIPEVDRTISMLDYFQLMDAAMRPEAEPDANPGSREITSQYLLLYESSGDPDDYERYLTFDRSALSLIVSIHGGSSVYLETAEEIAKTAAASAPVDVRVDTLGTTFLYSKAMEDLTRGMLQGLAVAAGLIFLVLVLGLGSLRLGLLATIPNLLPIIVCGGLFGWLGVPISMSTSLMGCIALGLAVDDTSHVVGHVSPHDSLERLYGLVGGPILLTTVALCSGYAVLLASEFATVEVLGASGIATLLLALAADLLVLPSLLALAGYPRTETEKLGRLEPLPKRRGAREVIAARG